MPIHKVTKVRKESPPLNPNHKHIIGVVTDDGVYHPNQEVAESIAGGDVWRTSVPDEPEAEIQVAPFCKHPWCFHKPYLESTPSETLANDIEKLPPG